MTTEGSSPYDDSLVASPASTGSPVAVRSFGPTDCASLHSVLEAWADRGSVWRPAPSLVDGPPCFWYATYHGWAVGAEILGNQTSGIARVRVEPPNDL